MAQVKLTPSKQMAPFRSSCLHLNGVDKVAYYGIPRTDHAVGHLWLLIINAASRSPFAASVHSHSLPKFCSRTPCAINARSQSQSRSLSISWLHALCPIPIPIRSLCGSSRSRTRSAKRQRRVCESMDTTSLCLCEAVVEIPGRCSSHAAACGWPRAAT